ncbi:MAG: FAD-binding protein, partial [Acidimicrobiia bacterium]|nr:FAD-binding protein [Acidimicrobiia bacterium]
MSSEFDAAFNMLSPDFGDRVERAAPLSQFTTYRLGGPAEILVRVRNVSELGLLATALEANPSVPILVIGRGSNLVVADAGVSAAVVILEEDFESVEIVDQVVTAGAGVPLPV